MVGKDMVRLSWYGMVWPAWYDMAGKGGVRLSWYSMGWYGQHGKVW